MQCDFENLFSFNIVNYIQNETVWRTQTFKLKVKKHRHEIAIRIKAFGSLVVQNIVLDFYLYC